MFISSASLKYNPIASIGLAFLAMFFANTLKADDGTWNKCGDSSTWKVTRLSGDVRVVEKGVTLASVSESMALRPGASIITGENGRIMLTHGAGSMMISPNSSITIPDTFRWDGSAGLLQNRGSVLFEVEKNQRRPFHVFTTYLAAVVKGTNFSVTLTAGEQTVKVMDGQVDVTEFRSSQSGLLSAGQSAIIATASEGLRVTGEGFIPPIRRGSPQPSPDIPGVDAETNNEARLDKSQPSPQLARASGAGMPGEGAISINASTSGSIPGNSERKAHGTTNWLLMSFIPVFVGFAVAFGVALRNKKRRANNIKLKDRRSIYSN